MIIIDTPFHITFRSLQDLPSFACIGKCKKAFWETDIEEESKEKCQQCDGSLTNAADSVHFKVLAKADRNLKVSDFKKYGSLENSERKQIQSYLAMNARIMHLSNVKPNFEKRAIKEWMPEGLSVKATIKLE